MAKRTNKKRRPVRLAKRTILLVGEGFDEVAFLNHVRSIYVTRGSGTSVVVKNAYGKGAGHVIKVAIKQSSNADYDEVAALFDTDTDWTKAAQDEARSKRIRTLLSAPCLEAMLIRSMGHTTQSLGSTLKNEFKAFLGGASNDAASYAKKFPRTTLELAANSESTLRALIDLLANRTNDPKG